MIPQQYLYCLRHNTEARLLGQKKPLLAGFKVTYCCNLRCRACPFWKKDGLHVTLHQAQQAMDTLYRDGVRFLILEGGEPFLWRDGEHTLEDIVSRAKRLFFSVGLTTNGTLPLESQADIIWVSIDGLKGSHDYNRGSTFDRVIENIKISHHPKILANLTINSLNWRDIPELVEFLSPLVKGITIQFYYPYPGTEPLSLPGTERRQVLDRLMSLKKEGYPVLDSVAALEALKANHWKCHPWLVASVEPDGQITYGCYLNNRAQVGCPDCGFAAHAEISLAFDWNPQAIATGTTVFGLA